MNKLFVILLLFPLLINAQLIDNRTCAAFSDEPFFYSSFIRENKIKKISGSVSTKKNLQVIQQKGNVSAYEFDTKGNLIKQFNSFDSGGKRDTTFVDYLYDSLGQLVTKRMSDSYGFYSYNYSFNDEGEIIEKKYCRDENCGRDRYHFKLKKQYTIVKEGYSYEKRDSVIVKNVLNNHGSAYLKETYYYNELGFLTKIDKKLIVNRKRKEVIYEYNDLGLVSEKKEIPDKTKNHFTRTTYQYDEFGNLEFIDEYRNEEKITHKEIIYNKSTYLMKALLIQDVETNFIKIVKYDYEFY